MVYKKNKVGYCRTWSEHAIAAAVLEVGVVIEDALAEDSCWGWYTPPATPPSNISYKIDKKIVE